MITLVLQDLPAGSMAMGDSVALLEVRYMMLLMLSSL